ncbi:hypothetical protein BDV96DRAFT_645282 [Lophiotrema nucula]|uniref:Uncharacterized protein n=1 Tax=Lophiotrema nucula TaxID=690887 RepID=A0A6A5ZDQ0_9PLEO|nr:hypothetical protein BDV96DRAFT_645282 [Lophiotrema nucula]
MPAINFPQLANLAGFSPEDMDAYEMGMEAEFDGGMRAVVFLDKCPSLPSTSPIDHPHIIDASQLTDYTPIANYRLCDGIATTLWNSNQEAFAKFFDEKVKVFEWGNTTDKEGAFLASFVVRRVGDEVTAGMYHVSGDVHDWDWHVKQTIDFKTGKWTAKFAAFNGTTPYKEGEPVAWDAFTALVLDGKNPVDPAHAQFGGQRVARSWLNNMIWDNEWATRRERKMAWQAD